MTEFPIASASRFRAELRARSGREKRRVAFAGADASSLAVAARLGREGLAIPVLSGDAVELRRRAAASGLDLESVRVLDPASDRTVVGTLYRECAASGVGEVEVREGLASNHARLWALKCAGVADTYLLRSGGPELPRFLAKRLVCRLRLHVACPEGATGGCSVVAVPEGNEPGAALLAGLAERAASFARALTGLDPRISFFAPGVPVFFGARSRFESARERLERHVREAAQAVLARGVRVDSPLALGRVLPEIPEPGEIRVLMLTHEDRPRAERRVADQLESTLIVGSVCEGDGESWGESGEEAGDESILDLALAAGLYYGANTVRMGRA